jgi:uncharacterized spore protein YtfJ
MRMSIPERVQSIVERLQTSASVKTVYGEPIKVDGKTIVPVARIAYGFGMCSCGKKGQEQEKEGKDQQSCGGGGGGLSIRPAGILEITEGETRFIPIGVGRKLAGALLVGLILGVLIAGKRSRDK